ncbi:hypothetical protein BU26DRAFT_207156 [Trematosphaeria pertusa]|uniref:Uncharacterized protein n=1 Tax=Trematosphaeria pertusa TaxID=390896 RepID=A0A6A6HR63_9PLEO|nr:uncharacterized protein BU26DRAFT_207156 [Trematosphaeria pertusa]KAF2240521.1 hypothetical protein BU26DRAFT_207156 [Trematosphaeria pertusa]
MRGERQEGKGRVSLCQEGTLRRGSRMALCCPSVRMRGIVSQSLSKGTAAARYRRERLWRNVESRVLVLVLPSHLQAGMANAWAGNRGFRGLDVLACAYPSATRISAADGPGVNDYFGGEVCLRKSRGWETAPKSDRGVSAEQEAVTPRTFPSPSCRRTLKTSYDSVFAKPCSLRKLHA